MQHTCIWMFGWFYRIWRWRNCSAPESLWDNTRKKWSGPPRCWEPVASYEEWDLQTVSWSMELLWLGNAEFHHTLGLFFKFLQTHDLVQAIEPPMGLGLHSTFSFFFLFSKARALEQGQDASTGLGDHQQVPSWWGLWGHFGCYWSLADHLPHFNWCRARFQCSETY